MNKKTLFITGLIILAIIIAGFYFYNKPPAPANGKYDDFAKCLASKNITMYGGWCSHCQSEKAAFEGSFKYVPYVECPDNPQLCLDKGIEGYPTWIFPDKKLVGEQGLEKLSQESGCPLPLK